MKTILKLFALFLVLQSFQCTDDNDNTITEEMLTVKRTEIENYIQSVPCSDIVGCGFMPIGSKPCGGAMGYIGYPKNIDEAKLKKMVDEYTQMDHLHNIQTNAISDCMAVMPPTEVKCVNGVCTIIK